MKTKVIETLKKYQELHLQATRMLSLFEDVPATGLLPLAEKLRKDTSKFLAESDISWNVCGNLNRHLSFLYRYLSQEQKEYCREDIKEIVFSDFPELFHHLSSLPDTDDEFDPAIKTAIFPLLDGGHYDSAIRKGFVLLTDRIRNKFNVQEQIDGEDLINKIFGGKSVIKLGLEESKKQSLRNLLAGFYGFFRNKFAHNIFEAKQSEAKTVLGMVNVILIEIESIEIIENA